MHVLHIYEASGVAATLCKYAPPDITTTHITFKDFPLGLVEHYGIKEYTNRYVFVMMCLLAARKADIIHVHNGPRLIKHLRRAKKPIIYHEHGKAWAMHGSDVCKMVEGAAAIIQAIPTTTDLQWPDTLPNIYIPNPVDTELFSRARPPQRTSNGLCRIIEKPGMSRSKTESWLRDNGYDVQLDWIIRSDMPNVPYGDLPEELSRYEYVADIDMRFGSHTPHRLYNLIGLQSMHMGIPTICWNGTHDTMPECHKPENVYDVLRDVYESVLE